MSEHEESNTIPADFINMEDILLAITRKDYRGSSLKVALEAAQQIPEEITPKLIEIIEQATEEVKAGGMPEGCGHLIAIRLLTEFEVKEALPVIIESISFPENLLFSLYDEVVTEELPRVFAALAKETPQTVDAIIADETMDYYVRSAAIGTYLFWVRDGLFTHDQAVEKLSRHLSEAIQNQDHDLATAVVAHFTKYAPGNVLDLIEEAFDRELVDLEMIGPRWFQKPGNLTEEHFQRALKYCKETGISDTVKECSCMYEEYDEAFTTKMERALDCSKMLRTAMEKSQSDEELRKSFTPISWEDDSPPDTIARTEAKVGRNSPCTCGSGKKHKKCCGRSQ